MKHLTYSAIIEATPQQVWSTMLDPITYTEWTGASWPDSYFEGQWKQGENIRFISPDGSGTLATITELRPLEHIAATHIAILQKGGEEDRTSDQAKNWIGTGEAYTFTPRNGGTEVRVDIEAHAGGEQMFNEGWPGALAALKQLAEKAK